MARAPTEKRAPRRAPLTRERILQAAVKLADAKGLESLSMRNLAQKLGVEAMSLYNHVPSKDALLDGMIDLVFEEIELPAGADWRAAMRGRAESVRAALRRHPWAIGLMESRATPGLANLRHHEAVLRTLRTAGFSVAMAGHAYALLDSYIYGFALQEQGLPFSSSSETAAVAEGMFREMPADAYPYLTEFMVQRALKPGYDFGHEFAFGLELVLDGLARALANDRG